MGPSRPACLSSKARARPARAPGGTSPVPIVGASRKGVTQGGAEFAPKGARQVRSGPGGVDRPPPFQDAIQLPPVSDFAQLASLEAVIDRARRCLSRADLPYLVMSDPGSGGYIEAYGEVLSRGVPALLEEHEGLRRLRGFDITENLLLAHSDASRSRRHRWFSILAAGIELLGWDGWEDPSPTSSLRHLLTDSFALRDDHDARAPLELLPALCRELQQACGDRHERVAALLSELLVGGMSAVEMEAKCQELSQCHEEFQPWGDDEGNPNPWYVERPAFLWGAMVQRRAELRGWLALVKAHFPSSPALARETRERLLRESEQWRRIRK
jgi:hypothetical protein